MKENIFQYSKNNLKEMITKKFQQPLYRTNQVWHWLYCHGVRDVDQMKNICKNLKEKINDVFDLARPKITKELLSKDGTIKWLLSFKDDNKAETVYIPESKRNTLCLSSQVGCTLTCKFCHTGKQRLVRNLSAGEIIQQIVIAKDHFNDWARQEKKLTNIVFMGMGEPFFNYDNVKQAVEVIKDQRGLNFGKKRITISTSGLVPQILQWGQDMKTRLAISLHSVTDEKRDMIMPINKKYPLKELLTACRKYADMTNGDRITFEYVMLRNINDSIDEAKKLLSLIKGIPAKINIIPFNSWPNSSFESSHHHDIKKFAQVIEDAGYNSPIRRPRGQDIMAACGQLKSDSEKVFASTNR